MSKRKAEDINEKIKMVARNPMDSDEVSLVETDSSEPSEFNAKELHAIHTIILADPFNDTALGQAMQALLQTGDEQEVIELIQQAPLRQIANVKQAILEIAFVYCCSTIMEIAVNLGADLKKTYQIKTTSSYEVNIDGYAKELNLLHLAAMTNNLEMISVLVQMGAKVDSLSDNLSTPLIVAVYRNNIAAACQLIKLGANPFHNNDTPSNALKAATEIKSKEMLLALDKALTEKKALIEESNATTNFIVALNTYSTFGHEYLNLNTDKLNGLIAGLATNPTTKNVHLGITPITDQNLGDLFLAIQNNTNLQKIIFPDSVDVKRPVVMGIQAKLNGNRLLVHNKDVSLAQLLSKNCQFLSSKQPLKLAQFTYGEPIKKDSSKEIYELILAGEERSAIELIGGLPLELNVKNARQLLQLAVQYRCLNIIEVAVNFGANLNEYIPIGQLIEMAVNLDANINECKYILQLKDAFSPLHWAAYLNDEEMISVLVQLGAEINLVAKYNRNSPLIIAVGKSNRAAACELTTLGANPYNAFRTAVTSKNIEMLKALVETSGKKDFTTVQEIRDLLHLAVFNSSDEIIYYLVDELGFDPSAPEMIFPVMATPITLAKSPEVKKYLEEVNTRKTSFDSLNKIKSFGHYNSNLNANELATLIESLAANPAVQYINLGSTPMTEQNLINFELAIKGNTNLQKIIFPCTVYRENSPFYPNPKNSQNAVNILARVNENRLLAQNRELSLAKLVGQEFRMFTSANLIKITQSSRFHTSSFS